ncbi:hypothetical protein [Olsenella sp. Marseille-P4559]|uniref:hypothetical protein n=1 Tax=Olsenella sp. Marseille-P4559 TaxID=2364795 RepID=UPI0013EF14B5|nr:hypothetical protein [Olsenella sp. Marseille-P4559]
MGSVTADLYSSDVRDERSQLATAIGNAQEGLAYMLAAYRAEDEDYHLEQEKKLRQPLE